MNEHVVAKVVVAVALLCGAAGCGGDAATTTTVSSPSPSATVSLTGFVTASTGAPIEGARVSIQPNPNTLNPSVFTNSEGTYRFDSLPAGDTLVHAEAARFDEAAGHVVVNGSNRLNFVLRPLPQVTLRGVVQDADTGAPITTATVTFLLTPGATLNAGRSAMTDGQGAYQFDNAYAANSNLSVTSPGYGEERKGLHIFGNTTLNFQLRRLP